MSIAEKCQTCYKYYHHTIDKGCPICREISFSERILCDLIREAQATSHAFECFAFRPNLSLVNSQTIERRDPSQGESIQHDINMCAKVKWFRSFASQQVHVAPGDIVYDIKFHLCLNTFQRKPLFSKKTGYSGKLPEMVHQSGNFFEGTVYLLGMATDHLHIYVDSTPEYSIDEIAHNIITATEKSLLKKFPELYTPDEPIFGTIYFAETIGDGIGELPTA